MKSRLLIIALFLTCFCGYSQNKRALFFQPSASVSGGGGSGDFETNTAGYTPLAWYQASDYTTNSTLATWPDRSTNAFNLTSTASTSGAKLVANGLNSLPVVWFNGTSAYVQSTTYTSSQPHEIIVVFAITNDTANLRIVDASTATSANRQGYLYLSAIGNVIDNVTQPIHAAITNQFYIADMVYNGASSQFYTNNVATVVASGSHTATMQGLTVAANGAHNSFGGNMVVAEILTFGKGNPIPGTNTTARTAFYNNLKSKYGL